MKRESIVPPARHYTAWVWRDDKILSIVRHVPWRQAFRFRSLIRDRGSRWEVWLHAENEPPALTPLERMAKHVARSNQRELERLQVDDEDRLT